MNNKPSAKKATVATVIFCILLVIGIVLTMTIGPCTRSAKVRNVTITFTGTLNNSNLQTALETALEGSVVLNEIDKQTTTATTTTTKKATTTTTTKATTTAATTTQGAAAAAETQTTTVATNSTTAGTTNASGSTTAAGSTTTTTKATTTTTSASGFKSGKMVATISNCDEKSDEELRKILNDTFAGKDYKNNNLVITEFYEVEPLGFSWTQIYACVIILIVAFVYCLIRYYSIGAVASAVSAVIPAIVAVIGSIGAALICNIFADINISAVAAVAVASTALFSIIVLENIKSGSDKDICTVISVASVIAVLLILVAIVSVIGWNGEVIFSSIQYAAAVVIAAISALTYVRCMFSRMAPKASNVKKTSGKKPVIK